MRRLIALPLTLLGALSIAASPAIASPAEDVARTWAIVPADGAGPDGRGQFELTAERGETLIDHVAVRNFGDEQLEVRLSAQDAVQGSGGSFELVDAEAGGGRGVVSWLELGVHEVTVPPRGHVVVDYSVRVPADAEPGDHAAGIVATAILANSDSATVRYGVGTRLHLRVGGAVTAALDVAQLRGRFEPAGVGASGALQVDAVLDNTGDVRLSPLATVSARTLIGGWSAESPLLEAGEILPDGRIDVAWVLDDAPAFGPIEVAIRVPAVESRGQDVTESAAISTSTVIVWAVPWLPLALLVAAAATVVAAVIVIRSRRGRVTAPPAALESEITA